VHAEFTKAINFVEAQFFCSYLGEGASCYSGLECTLPFTSYYSFSPRYHKNPHFGS